VGLCVVPLLVDPWGWDAWQPIRGLVLGGMALALMIYLWTVLPGWYAAMPPLLLAGVAALTGLGLLMAEDRRLAWDDMSAWWIGLAWLLLLVHPLAVSPSLRRDLWRAMAVALLLQLTVGIGQRQGWLPGAPAGSMSNGNFQDAWLLCLLPGTAALVMRERGLWRWIGLAALVGGLAGVLGGRTMGAVLGLAALVPVYGMALAMRRWPQWGRRPGWTALAVVLVLGLGAGGFYRYWQQRVAIAYQEGVPGRVESEEERALLWRETADIIAAHPWGVGPGRWPEVLLDRGVVAVRAGYGTRFHQHAHNDFLEFTAAHGWLGGLGLLLALGLLLWRGWRQIGTTGEWPVDLAAVGLVVAWTAFACTNYPAAQVEFVWLLVLGCAVLSRRMVLRTGSNWARLPIALLMLALLAGLWADAQRLREERLTRDMVAALWDGDRQAMLLAGERAEAAGLAVERFSGTPSAWYTGAARLWLGDLAGACAPLARAYALAPTHPQVAYLHGQALMGAGQYRQAAEVLRQLVGLHLDFDWARMAWVNALLAAGEEAEACAVAGHWRGTEGEAPGFAELIARACGNK
jgi:O-antigen ligase